MKGRLSNFFAEKNYGFVKGEDGKEYFFHKDDFVSSSEYYDMLKDFDYGAWINLEFEVAQSQKGPRAAIVRRVYEEAP